VRTAQCQPTESEALVFVLLVTAGCLYCVLNVMKYYVKHITMVIKQ